MNKNPRPVIRFDYLEYGSDMAEISGFGGGYEECCRMMVLRGVAWLRRFQEEHGEPPYLEARTIENVFGLITPANEVTRMLIDEMTKENEGEVTGAMVQATVTHVFYISKNGWDEYVKLKKEQFETEKHYPE